MKVYISGKIDEEVICETTRQKFARAEKKLKTDGYEVFNPCDQNWQAHLKAQYEKDRKTYQPYTDGSMPDFYSYCLLRNLMALSVKDAPSKQGNNGGMCLCHSHWEINDIR